MATNLDNLLRREFCQMARFAATLSPFTHLVCDVIRVITKKKMAWANASWIVAPMADVHAVWDLAEVKFPREPVSRNDLSVRPAKGDFSVSSDAIDANGGASPKPATFGLLNPSPKITRSRRPVFALPLIMAAFGTEDIPVSAGPTGFYEKRLPATRTDALDFSRLALHRKTSISGATGPDVRASRPHLCRSHFTNSAALNQEQLP